MGNTILALATDNDYQEMRHKPVDYLIQQYKTSSNILKSACINLTKLYSGRIESFALVRDIKGRSYRYLV
jgi:hypothetical protein